jgi:hypothetical protein
VSGAIITGAGVVEAYESIRERLRKNAIVAMQDAASVPDVRITHPLREGTTPQGLRCWTLEAETKDRSIIFLQSALEGEGGVLLVTFEAPHGSLARTVFNEFIENVRSSTAKSVD